MAFNIPEFFQRLQWLQDQHDQHYHQDIYTMSRADNLTHMTMHMAKYTGKIVALGTDTEYLMFSKDRHAQYASTLTDYLIVLMSAANRINLNLGNSISMVCREHHRWGEYGGFFPNRETAVDFIRSAMTLAPELLDADLINQTARLTIGIGRMAKALEALDHMEEYPSREVLTTEVAGLFQHALRLYHFYAVESFIEAIYKRMGQIERANFLYGRRPKYAEGFIPVES